MSLCRWDGPFRSLGRVHLSVVLLPLLPFSAFPSFIQLIKLPPADLLFFPPLDSLSLSYSLNVVAETERRPTLLRNVYVL